MALQDIHTSMVEYQSDGTKIAAFLARPAGAGPYPAMLVLQEWWGLNNHIKDIAMRFAGEGYVALAPDLYARQGSGGVDGQPQRRGHAAGSTCGGGIS
jgi:dienelactone hydrolase